MVRRAINDERWRVMVSEDPRHVWVKFRFDSGRDKWFAILGAEDKVDQN
jgi:hypothetical protein